MAAPQTRYQIAVPIPLRRTLDYLGAKGIASGARVVVPVGRRRLVGVVLANRTSRYDGELKPIEKVLDTEPVFPCSLQRLLSWASRYYHHPIGEVMQTALPTLLRQTKPVPDPDSRPCYRIAPDTDIPQARQALQRAPKQQRVFDCIRTHGHTHGWMRHDQLAQAIDAHQPALRALQKKHLVQAQQRSTPPDADATDPTEARPTLTEAQQQAVQAILADSGFVSFLLQGITGSGKTEVYLEAAQAIIAQGRQVLILVPEITLTPQFIARIKARLGHNLGVLHSGLSERARYRNWWLARRSSVATVLGTRSAVFAPLPRLGLIIVDEEHDPSYKQQDGFRYNARDIALQRASMEQIPIVLGSATPSLESTHRVNQGRCRQLVLQQRYGRAKLPSIETIDLKQFTPTDGISQPLLNAVRLRLERGEQTILFINRRGFAPMVHCIGCGWQASCQHCDARVTYHQPSHKFRCHHCAGQWPALEQCPQCRGNLTKTGIGTQRVAQGLAAKIPAARILRLDRDQITTQTQLTTALEQIRANAVDIVVGTQLISKGHDFPRVTLVGIVNADQGLFGVDFRSAEHLFQQLVQVSGRAGRAQHSGQVLIQTSYPQSEILHFIQRHDYDRFARHYLQERRQAGFPPYRFLALWRAESTDKTAPRAFLDQVRAVGRRVQTTHKAAESDIMDVVASPMEKLAGRFRWQLLVRAPRRSDLHRLLTPWIEQTEKLKKGTVRWSIDIDPIDMY